MREGELEAGAAEEVREIGGTLPLPLPLPPVAFGALLKFEEGVVEEVLDSR